MAEELSLRVSETGDEPVIKERSRWRHMRAMWFEGFDLYEMVEPLQKLGLVSCRNCKAGASKTRTTADGEEICETCEDTVTQFWRRTLARIAKDESEVLEVKGGWIAAHAFIAATCRKNAVTVAEVVTERTAIERHTKIENGVEHTYDVPVTTRTVRRERKVNITALRLLAEVEDKLATMAGLDVTTPEGATPPPPRKKQHVHRLEEGAEPPPN